jgi:hypothetical protein
MTDDMMPSAANGGIVAFADNPDQPVSEDMPKTEPIPERATSTFGDFIDRILPTGGVNEEGNKIATRNKQGVILAKTAPGPFEKLTPTERKQKEANTELARKAYKEVGQKSTYTTLTPQQALEARLQNMQRGASSQPDASKIQEQIGADANWGTVPTATAGGKKKGISDALAVGQAAQNVAQNAGVEEQPLEDRAMTIYKKFKEMSSAELKGLNDAIEGKKGDADKIKAKGLSEALMQFGFGMAANAAKPGAKFFGSAAGAAPILGQVASENEKLQRAARDNYMKLKMDQTRYQVALDKGDMQAATSLASQIRQGNMQQKQLDAQIDHWNKQLQLERQKMGVTAAAYAPQSIREAEWLMANKDNPAAMSAYEKSTRQKDVAGIRANSTQQLALEKSLEKLKENYPMLKLDQSTPEWKKAWAAYTAEANRITERHRKMFNDPTLMNPDIGGGATLNPNVKVLN